MLVWKRAIWLFLASLLIPATALSHALHPDSIDRYADITLTPSHLVVVYQAVLGINPTEKASKRLDPDDDNEITEAERDAYLNTIAQEYAHKQLIMLGGQRLDLQFKGGDAYAIQGHNGIFAIKLDFGYVCELPADLPRNATVEFSYEDQALSKVVGWKQVQFHGQNGVAYAGHVPYRDYKPFDYEILNTKGFAPSTDSIHLQVMLPTAVQEAAPAFALPEKMLALDVGTGIQISQVQTKKKSSWLGPILGGIVVLFTGAAVTGWLLLRKQS